MADASALDSAPAADSDTTTTTNKEDMKEGEELDKEGEEKTATTEEGEAGEGDNNSSLVPLHPCLSLAWEWPQSNALDVFQINGGR